jgi:hypothetical protein
VKAELPLATFSVTKVFGGLHGAIIEAVDGTSS